MPDLVHSKSCHLCQCDLCYTHPSVPTNTTLVTQVLAAAYIAPLLFRGRRYLRGARAAYAQPRPFTCINPAAAAINAVLVPRGCTPDKPPAEPSLHVTPAPEYLPQDQVHTSTFQCGAPRTTKHSCEYWVQ
ncbi:hypothetical protein NDU88_003712 [Pleurodeles waltl]|uniref:Uncharacterized protein n=1 Tax=Pleurodeles waltl TaxID=8319 RepID=A0AAV7M643_PLEWA|nr:hypothetical protein NDU88_003712 [Pleurodeles waltl]